MIDFNLIKLTMEIKIGRSACLIHCCRLKWNCCWSSVYSFRQFSMGKFKQFIHVSWIWVWMDISFPSAYNMESCLCKKIRRVGFRVLKSTWSGGHQIWDLNLDHVQKITCSQQLVFFSDEKLKSEPKPAVRFVPVFFFFTASIEVFTSVTSG